jgi:hypothetical protein
MSEEFRKPRPDIPLLPHTAYERKRILYKPPKGRRGKKPKGKAKRVKFYDAPKFREIKARDEKRKSTELAIAKEARESKREEEIFGTATKPGLIRDRLRLQDEERQETGRFRVQQLAQITRTEELHLLTQTRQEEDRLRMYQQLAQISDEGERRQGQNTMMMANVILQLRDRGVPVTRESVKSPLEEVSPTPRPRAKARTPEEKSKRRPSRTPTAERPPYTPEQLATMRKEYKELREGEGSGLTPKGRAVMKAETQFTPYMERQIERHESARKSARKLTLEVDDAFEEADRISELSATSAGETEADIPARREFIQTGEAGGGSVRVRTTTPEFEATRKALQETLSKPSIPPVITAEEIMARTRSATPRQPQPAPEPEVQPDFPQAYQDMMALREEGSKRRFVEGKAKGHSFKEGEEFYIRDPQGLIGSKRAGRFYGVMDLPATWVKGKPMGIRDEQISSSQGGEAGWKSLNTNVFEKHLKKGAIELFDKEGFLEESGIGRGLVEEEEEVETTD